MGRLGASGTQPPVTAACQKELAKPRQTKFRTEIPSIPLGEKEIHLTVDVKAKTKKEHGNSTNRQIKCLNPGLVGRWGVGFS